MTRPPEFITFTGADDWTDVAGMVDLSRQYPIEWGILFSPSRQGVDARYPSAGGDALFHMMWANICRSAHLCGQHSRDVMSGKSLATTIPVDLGHFGRVQVNHAQPVPRTIMLEIQDGWGPTPIAQCRGASFPVDTSVDWLFDCSGGRGETPVAWPEYPGRLVGYAGGIGPDNVASVIESIAATGPYWIDMESKVRTNDRFDLALVRRVCEIVYPAASTGEVPDAR